VSHEQSSATRARRAVLELAMLLSDGNWHTTSYLGVAAGKYLRPEVAWRTGRGDISRGQRLYVNNKLDVWERAGRVEKRRNSKFTEWRLAKSDWVLPYLRTLIEMLKEQAKNGYGQLVGRKRTSPEREGEILTLHRQGLSAHRIAELLGCHQTTVSRVVKAFAVQVGGDAAASLSLRHRAVIADAQPEKQAGIVRSVIEKKLTVQETKRLVRLARNDYDQGDNEGNKRTHC
jgi:predicted transcriptional regulator